MLKDWRTFGTLAYMRKLWSNLWLMGVFFSIIWQSSIHAIPNDPTTETIAERLKEAHVVKNYDLERAVGMTNRLLKQFEEQANDSLVNFIKYRHSLYLLLLDRNEQSREMILEILSYYKQKDVQKWTTLSVRLGSIEIRYGNYEKAIKYLESALPYTEENGMTISQGLTYLHLSDIYRLKYDFANAYKYADLALKLYSNNSSFDWISLALTSLGYICVMAKDYEGATAYFDQIFKARKKIKNKNFLVRPVLYSGIMHFERGDMVLAKSELEEGLAQINSLGNFPDLAVVYQYISRIYILGNEYDKAELYIEKAIEHAQKAKNKREQYRGLLILLQVKMLARPNENHLNQAMEAYVWALENGDNILLKESSNYLSSHYLNRGNYQEALRYKDVYVDASEKETAKEKLNEIALLEEKSKYEEEARDLELNEQKLQLELESNERVRNMMIVGLCLLMLVFILLIYYYSLTRKAYFSLNFSNKILRKTEQRLELKNTELKKYIESNIQLEQFAHVASHDLRAPLITINSFARLLHDKVLDKLSDSEKMYLGYIRSNGEQMLELVNDLLEYSKINSQKIISSEVDTHDLVSSVIHTLKNHVHQHEISLNIVGQLPTINADEIKIKRVFQNLISNAIKFSDPAKKSRVDISFVEEGGHWNFYVKDNGIGIKDKHVDIFQPYIQLNRKAEYKGTGLGLSFCKKIIEQHGGEIAFDSNFGKGSTFYFSISKEIQ